MVMFKCPRCGYEFSKRKNYIDHVNRQKKCQPLVSNIELTYENYIELQTMFSCEYCNKEFSEKYTIAKHMKNCTENPENKQKIQVADSIVNNNADTININTNNINSNNNNNTNYNAYYIVNDFKNTNFSYITDDKTISFMKSCMKALPNLIEEIHFNPKHPENHNMYLSNFKEKTAKYKKGDKWLIKNGSEFVDDIIVDYHNKMFNNYVNDEEMLEKYPDLTNIYNKYYNTTQPQEAMNKVKKEIYEIMHNNKDMVFETEKKLKIKKN
jgi:hypothetical protein